MKICFIGDSNSIHTKRWYKFFRKEGYSIDIISWNKDPEIPQKNMHNIPFNFILRIKYLRAIFILIWSIRRIHKINPNLIHIHMISNYGWACLFIKNIPIIVSIGGYDILIRAKVSRIHFFLSKLLLKKADGVTTSSKFIKSELIEKFYIKEEKIKYFSWGIDFKLFSSIPAEERKNNKIKYNIPEDYIVLFHNRYFPAAKYKILFDSIKNLNDIYSEFVLILVKGVSVDKDWLKAKRYVENLGIGDKVIFIDKFVSQGKMSQLLSFSDIYINILTHDQRGLSILEAMAAGCIPAVNNLPVYHEFIKNEINGIIFDSEEPEPISKKIYWIIKNLSELKSKFRKYNYVYIRENDDKGKNEYIMKELYMEVLG
ncbi:MAG: glycosyltransferase family 4 protein [Candidatus Helarchaeota archaeon]|nr:glycosyltransferase family 4 protein [Candidatus Helarchaeota archaeon]